MKWSRALAATAALVCTLVVPGVASAIDEFPLPAGTRPGGITTGPDGALWFTEEGGNSIGRITPDGVITNHFPIPTLVSGPNQVTLGPDGRMWFTESTASPGKIGALNPQTGAIQEYSVGASPQGITAAAAPDQALWFTEAGTNRIRRIDVNGNVGPDFTIPTGSSDPSDVELGADGRLWFTEQATTASKIGAVTTTGSFQEFGQPQGVTPGSEPASIISTTGGVLWFTESAAGAIGRITTGGAVAEFGGAGAAPSGIAASSRDGALWFTESPPQAGVVTSCPPPAGLHAIGRITSGGTITNQFPTPTLSSEPSDITEGPDGAMWFSEFCADKIGRIATAAPVPPPPPPPAPVATLSVSSLKMSPTSFRAAPRGASIAAKKKGKTGTTVSYKLSTAATTRFTVEQPQRGQKRGKKCVKPKRGKKGKRCTRYVVIKSSFKHSGKVGSNKFRFSGRVGGKKLRPGKYRLVAVATTGATKSKQKRANFKIVR